MDSRAHHDGNHGKPSHHHPAPTKAELMSSAKLLAEAAKGKSHQTDKAELAGAAADLLNAAAHYGKLEGKGTGKYVGKAEDYLHNYHSSHSQTGSGHHAAAAAAHSGGNHNSGGYGEYIKMAEGILKKQSTHESSTTTGGHSNSNSGNKYGEYAKMAGDFLKKH